MDNLWSTVMQEVATLCQQKCDKKSATQAVYSAADRIERFTS